MVCWPCVIADIQSANGRSSNTPTARKKNNLLAIMLFGFYVALDEGVKIWVSRPRPLVNSWLVGWSANRDTPRTSGYILTAAGRANWADKIPPEKWVLEAPARLQKSRN